MSEQHHQDWATPFQTARTEAEGRKQQAIQEAHRAFEKAKHEAEQQRTADYLAARDWFDSLKSTPDDPDYPEARDTFQRSKAPASLAKARKALADAIHKADAEYKSALVKAGQTHQVTIH